MKRKFDTGSEKRGSELLRFQTLGSIAKPIALETDDIVEETLWKELK